MKTTKQKLEGQPNNNNFWQQLFWFLSVHIGKFILVGTFLAIIGFIIIGWLTTDIIIARNKHGLYIKQIQKKGADVQYKIK